MLTRILAFLFRTQPKTETNPPAAVAADPKWVEYKTTLREHHARARRERSHPRGLIAAMIEDVDYRMCVSGDRGGAQ